MMKCQSVSVKAPGKIILQGEHAAVYKKLAIAAALGQYTEVQINFDNDVSINIFDNIKCTFAPSELLNYNFSEVDHFIEILKLNLEPLEIMALKVFIYLYYFICARNNPALGCHVKTETELPIGMGLGSSASYSVALSASLLLYSGQIKNVTSNDSLNSINHWSLLAECIIHGNPSGLDNTISCYGGFLMIKDKQTKVLNIPMPFKVLCINSGVKRSTKTMIDIVQDHIHKFPKLGTLLLDSIEEIGNQMIISLIAYNDSDQKLCNGIISDNNLTSISNCSKLETNYENLSILMGTNNDILNALGAGHPELDNIVRIIRKANIDFYKNLITKRSYCNSSNLDPLKMIPVDMVSGDHKTLLAESSKYSSYPWTLRPKITGAGGGGFMISLLPVIPPDSRFLDLERETLEKLIEYVRKILAESGYDSFVANIGVPGVQLLNYEEK